MIPAVVLMVAVVLVLVGVFFARVWFLQRRHPENGLPAVTVPDVEQPPALVPLENGILVQQPDGQVDVAVKARNEDPCMPSLSKDDAVGKAGCNADSSQQPAAALPLLVQPSIRPLSCEPRQGAFAGSPHAAPVRCSECGSWHSQTAMGEPALSSQPQACQRSQTAMGEPALSSEPQAGRHSQSAMGEPALSSQPRAGQRSQTVTVEPAVSSQPQASRHSQTVPLPNHVPALCNPAMSRQPQACQEAGHGAGCRNQEAQQQQVAISRETDQQETAATSQEAQHLPAGKGLCQPSSTSANRSQLLHQPLRMGEHPTSQQASHLASSLSAVADATCAAGSGSLPAHGTWASRPHTPLETVAAARVAAPASNGTNNSSHGMPAGRLLDRTSLGSCCQLEQPVVSQSQHTQIAT